MTIGITMGDPKGIGPEIIAKAWRALTDEERDDIVIYGDLTVLNAAADLTQTVFNHKQLVITSSTMPPAQKVDNDEAARIAISAIDAATSDAASGKIAAIVTAPVNKHRMRSAKPGFTGHTEYLAKIAHVRDVVMMFAPEDYSSVDIKGIKRACFSLVTTHLPISEVPAAITTDRVLATVRQTHHAMVNFFACPDARIAVMSLNPHAGESGAMGSEEKSAITPAIQRASKEGINCFGPLAADSLFRNMSDFDYDAVVAMYHDQGLLPAKLLCGCGCVNMTLGLPYLRTSPGHGTAEDIAWLGTADEAGMLSSIRLARRLVGWKLRT